MKTPLATCLFSLLKVMWKFLKWSLIIFILLIGIILLLPEEDYSAVSVPISSVTRDTSKHVRTEDQTFLTYPEWFLVFSPDELAKFLQVSPAHEFPFFEHVDQLWESYAVVTDATKKYAYNDEYHTMIKVIGVSTEIEYKIKWGYEKTIGQLSWIVGGEKLTAEDLLYAKNMRSYVEFIKLEPWYKFNFKSLIKDVWTVERNDGDSVFRGIERKVAFTIEYALKSAYGKLIGLAAKNSYDQPIMFTLVKTDKEIDTVKFNEKNNSCKIEKYKEDSPNYYLFPRYYPFTQCMEQLGKYGEKYGFVGVEKIAENNNIILVSIISEKSETFAQYGTEILRQSIATDKEKVRVLLQLPIKNLDVNLDTMRRHNIVVEHVFDF